MAGEEYMGLGGEMPHKLPEPCRRCHRAGAGFDGGGLGFPARSGATAAAGRRAPGAGGAGAAGIAGRR